MFYDGALQRGKTPFDSGGEKHERRRAGIQDEFVRLAVHNYFDCEKMLADLQRHGEIEW